MLVSQGIIVKYSFGGGGGGLIDVYTKKHGRTTRAAWDRMLYQDPCICWFKLQRYLNPKMTRKEEAQFLLPPPPPHTHTCAGAIHKGSVFEKCFLSEVITLNTKFAPLSPQKSISDPLRPTPPPLRALP